MSNQGHLQIYLSVLAAFPLILGVMGLIWSTIGAPWLAFIFYTPVKLNKVQDSTSGGVDRPLQRLRLEILVAAFNEEKIIRNTLLSLQTAGLMLRSAYGDIFDLRITVGLDHCTDGTAAVVTELAQLSEFPIQAIENQGDRGKWQTLLTLIGLAKADWVALVDCGSIWEPGLLVAAWPSILDPSVLGVAPSYGAQKSGLLESANWRLERRLKKAENRMGGPVSVHGATVLYRRLNLLGALATLHGQTWLNDDVVVPLVLRLQNPGSRIAYLADGVQGSWVSDAGVVSELSVEYRRRRRMVMGNLQWIRLILFPHVSVILVASRRVFRVFWAYWVLLILIGCGAEIALALREVSGSAEIARALLLELSLLVCAVGAAGGWLFSNWVRRLGVAFVNGLLVTLYWKELRAERGVSWV